MLIRPITTNLNTNIKPLKKFSTLPVTQVQCDSNYKSIYASNASEISFGAVVHAPISSFEKEIAEQPKVLKNIIDKAFVKSGKINMPLNIDKKAAKQLERIHIVASGSSRHSGLMAKNFIEDMTGLPVMVHEASEFMNQKIPMDSKKDLAIYISQSGGTADTLHSLNKTKGMNVKSVALTNNADSKIAKAADSHISIQAGEEKAVAATKTVTTSILNLMILGMKLGELRGNLDSFGVDKYAIGLRRIPAKLENMLKDTANVKAAAKVLAPAENIYFYAKGSNVGAAYEGALKLTETTGKRVIAGSSSEALHGTFASIKPEDPVLEIIVGKYSDGNYSLATQNFQEIIEKRHTKNPIIIKNASDNNLKNQFENNGQVIFIDIPQTKEEFTPILSTVRFQQLTNEITKLKNIDPDNGGGFLTKFRDHDRMKG